MPGLEVMFLKFLNRYSVSTGCGLVILVTVIVCAILGVKMRTSEAIFGWDWVLVQRSNGLKVRVKGVPRIALKECSFNQAAV